MSEEDKDSDTKKVIWKMKSTNSYMNRRIEVQENNLQSIFAVIWGQCTSTMQLKLESLKEYDQISSNYDCAWVWKAMKGITHHFEGTRYMVLSLDEDSRMTFYLYKQSNRQTLHEYLTHFSSLIEVLEHYGARPGEDAVFIKSVKNLIKEEVAPAEESEPVSVIEANYNTVVTAARNRSIGVVFLKRSDRRAYGYFWTELENQYTRGNDQYPLDMTAAYNLHIPEFQRNKR